jgi:hypothetical protein
MEIDIENNQAAAAMLGLIILIVLAITADASVMSAVPVTIYWMMLAGVIGAAVLFYILLVRTYHFHL